MKKILIFSPLIFAGCAGVEQVKEGNFDLTKSEYFVSINHSEKIKDGIVDSFYKAEGLISSNKSEDRELGWLLMQELSNLGFSPAKIKLGLKYIEDAYNTQGLILNDKYENEIIYKYKNSFDIDKEDRVKKDKIDYRIKKIKTLHEGYGKKDINKNNIIEVPKIEEKEIVLGADGLYKELELQRERERLQKGFLENRIKKELKTWKENSKFGSDEEKLELIRYIFDNRITVKERELLQAKDILLELVRKDYNPAKFVYAFNLITGNIFKKDVGKGMDIMKKIAISGNKEALIFLESIK